MQGAGSVQSKINNPLWLLAEVTYKCPLHCVFCYNPVDYTQYGPELSTEEWLRVLREGREIGCTQLGFSGGEPLMRDDLEIMVAEARKLGYYSNLITSGVGLTEKRISAFKQGGLDHIQLSFQDSTREINDFISSTKTFELKSGVQAVGVVVLYRDIDRAQWRADAPVASSGPTKLALNVGKLAINLRPTA